MHYNFDLDLQDGVKGETHLATLLNHKKIEVKRDFLVSDTGNIVVEFESRENPSGIITTEADWWAFILDGHKFKTQQIILIKTERLRWLIENCNFPIVQGGDNKTSKMYLISISYLCNY